MMRIPFEYVGRTRFSVKWGGTTLADRQHGTA